MPYLLLERCWNAKEIFPAGLSAMHIRISAKRFLKPDDAFSIVYKNAGNMIDVYPNQIIALITAIHYVILLAQPTASDQAQIGPEHLLGRVFR